MVGLADAATSSDTGSPAKLYPVTTGTFDPIPGSVPPSGITGNGAPEIVTGWYSAGATEPPVPPGAVEPDEGAVVVTAVPLRDVPDDDTAKIAAATTTTPMIAQMVLPLSFMFSFRPSG